MSYTMVKAGVSLVPSQDATEPILTQAAETLWSYLTWSIQWILRILIGLLPVSSWRQRLQAGRVRLGSTSGAVSAKRRGGKLPKGKLATGSPSPRRSRRLKEKQGSGPSGSGVSSSSSSSSESDSITDSDSNASDVQHPRQLGHLRGPRTSKTPPVKRSAQNTLHRTPSILCRKKTLVLDLDETLIHSTSRHSRNYDHVVEVTVDRHVCLYYVFKRPFCDFFLQKVSEWYNVVIFTASMPEYADPVIDWLDPRRNMVSQRLFRQACRHSNGTYIKNLAIVEPDLSQVCLVDNSPISYQDNEDNGIPIEGWISDPRDEALLDMLLFLDALRYVDDVRHVLSMK
ncbi:hypothetical protein SpCBS45565_g06404 [Spizellomyces sp. 'palustris']|nr:hypothetical protein SpCBS45565_g06404 [Spizellomyces sp. 'palustris']